MTNSGKGEVLARHFANGEAVRVRWRNGSIVQMKFAENREPPDTWIAPALFDLQVNGYGGIDFQQDELTNDDLLVAVRGLRQAGCTRFLLTLVTDEWSRLTARLRHLRRLRSQSPELQAAIAGWHIEGPFLSEEPGFHGAHDPALMFSPRPEHIHELRSITEQDHLLLTIAPERGGAIPAIRLAASLGIKVSLGHTNATGDILRQAMRARASAFTHLGNGCPRELDRHDNIIWRVLETPGLNVSLIPDAIHVSPPLFRLLHRSLGWERIFYVSDAMSAAGMPPGRYKLGKWELEVGKDQVVRQPGKPLFAGSALRPIDGIVRAAQMLDCSWSEIWPRFSAMPARLMGLTHELAVGLPAEFCLFELKGENEFAKLETICAAEQKG